MTFLWIICATLIVSIISLVGIFTFGIKTKIFDKILILLVSFAAGSLIGSAFLHLLPEAVLLDTSGVVFFYALIGFTCFFIMERYFHWRHCHEGVCDVHAFTYLNLFGDGMHNFVDGMIIAASFVADFRLGIVTTIAVVLHEVPQEMGDFGILVYGGFSKTKALIANFICAAMAIIGAILGYVLSNITESILPFLLSFTAGGFIYIGASDLIPELHRQKDDKRANMAFITFILGLIFMVVVKVIDI